MELDVDEEFSAMRDIVNHLREYEDQFEKLDAMIHNMHSEFQSTFNSAFDQVVARLDALDARRTVKIVENGKKQVVASYPPIPPHWRWVDNSIVQDIIDGKFKLTTLPQLHRDEKLRSKPSASDNLHPAFEDMMIFLRAWMVYASIRSFFSPEKGSALASWTERLLHHHSNFSWPVILSYAVAYFEKHQNSPPEVWYSDDAELVAKYLVTPPPPSTLPVPPLVAPAPITAPARRSPPKRKVIPNHVGPIHLQICENWNRRIGGCKIKESVGRDCPRRHVCLHCEKEGHESYKCPLKQQATVSN
jgi:hypothetical protein